MANWLIGVDTGGTFTDLIAFDQVSGALRRFMLPVSRTSMARSDSARAPRARASVLSGGERQMLAISIALMTRPKLLLLDEPSAGLAPILVQRLFEMIRVIRDRFGTAVLLVEQNVNEALRIVEEVCVLEEGRVVFSGAAANKEEIVRHLWRLDRRTY